MNLCVLRTRLVYIDLFVYGFGVTVRNEVADRTAGTTNKLIMRLRNVIERIGV